MARFGLPSISLDRPKRFAGELLEGAFWGSILIAALDIAVGVGHEAQDWWSGNAFDVKAIPTDVINNPFVNLNPTEMTVGDLAWVLGSAATVEAWRKSKGGGHH